MRKLSAAQILSVWEQGKRRHPLEQALLLLRVAYPQGSDVQLAELSVGQRDAGLLQLRSLTFGPKLNSMTSCPECQCQLEFGLSVADIQFSKPVVELAEEGTAAVYDFVQEDYQIKFRLPNSYDLGAIAPVSDIAASSAQLLSRCLVAAQYKGEAVDIEALPGSVRMQISEQMIEHDPQAEVLMPLVCPDCDHSWQSLFDIVSFFWAELTNLAKQLLQEVHILARFYGWRESDILAMSGVRRQFYLDRVDRAGE